MPPDDSSPTQSSSVPTSAATMENKAVALARKKKGMMVAATTPFPLGCGGGAAATTTPSPGFSATTTSSQAGFGTAAPAASSQTGFGAVPSSPLAESSPIDGRRVGCFTNRGFTGHNVGGFTGTSLSPTGFPFLPSPSPSLWDSAGVSSSSTAFTWDKNVDPSGGFMRYFGNQPHNFHLVGAPLPETNGGSLSPDVEILSEKVPKNNIDERENENVRTEKRIMWTPKEDEVLMSAWIENSTDSTTGADRKGEAYWGDVIKAYNKNTPSQRHRNAKQAKDRWHKLNRWRDLFECAYLKARKVYTSGYSDQMWMDAADEFYLEDNKNEKLGPFVLKNVWKICREVPKWKTYNDELKNARKRKSYHLEEDGENLQTEDETPKRPPGQKAAKKAALAIKDKSKAMQDDVKLNESTAEKLDKLSKVQEEANAKRMKVLELQQKLSTDKIETTKLAHLTAQENKESKKLKIEGRKLEMESKKLEKESKIMDAYNNLISQDTTSMTDDEKVERVAAMKCLRKMLFLEFI